MKEEGFTLIEILIAITITGIILGSVFTSLDLGFSTWERSDTNNKYEQEWRVAASFLRRDIHKLFISSLYQKNKLQGSYQSISGILLEDGSLKEFAYFYDSNNNSLVRKLKNLETDEVIEEIEFFKTLNLKRVEFNFYDAKDQFWKDSWSYQEEERLPIAVKLEVELEKVNFAPLIVEIYLGQEY
ncbi:prepilin-type N-terminal cleavage/methylation domain-containing protein [Orenia marismortui]|uniref:prepilin-type N-terminal cleavage/methylation domain-containing protein n=1 Tax=Orenia marismortui TaxID=46469 RepID=UPI0003788CBA|nr:prepilin-type N-terminal cleavage/methylation domain-containing protein [Orenia marismortui]